MVNVGVLGDAGLEIDRSPARDILRLFVKYVKEGRISEDDSGTILTIVKALWVENWTPPPQKEHLNPTFRTVDEIECFFANRVIFRDDNTKKIHNLFTPDDHSRAAFMRSVIHMPRLARNIIAVFDLTRDLTPQLKLFTDLRFFPESIAVCLTSFDLLDPARAAETARTYQETIEAFFARKGISVSACYPVCTGQSEEFNAYNVAVVNLLLDMTIGRREDQVRVTHEYDYEGGLIRFKVVVKNNTGLSITSVEVSLRRAEHVRLVRIAPKVYANPEAEKAVMPSMSHRQSQSFDFYLEPLICGTVPVESMVIYQDATGKSRSVICEPKLVRIKCPPVVPVKDASLANVEHLFGQVLKAKQRKSFECRADSQQIFTYMVEAIQLWGGLPVSTTFTAKGPYFMATAYFFVKSKAKTGKKGSPAPEQIVLKATANEEAGTAAVEVAADSMATASGIITHVWSLCQRRLVETLSCELKALWCPECGASLEEVPEEGAPVQCKHCDQWIHAVIK